MNRESSTGFPGTAFLIVIFGKAMASGASFSRIFTILSFNQSFIVSSSTPASPSFSITAFSGTWPLRKPWISALAPILFKVFLIPTSEERNGNFLFPFRPSDVGILYSFILPYYDRARIYFYELSADDLLGCFGKIAE